MDVNLKGFKTNCEDMPMGEMLIHKGRRMTESETRKLVNWGIEHDCECASDIPDEVADKICDPANSDFDCYDDTPQFITLNELERILNRIQIEYYVDWDADEIMVKLREELK